MPYFFVAAAFLMFFLAAAVGTLFALVYGPFRALFPYVWRIWFWGSLGFVVANALFLVVFWFGFLPLLDATTSPQWLHNIAGFIGAATALLGPFFVSAIGVGGGSLLGCIFAWRSGRGASVA